MKRLIALCSTPDKMDFNTEISVGDTYDFATPHGFVVKSENDKIGGNYTAAYPVLDDSVFRILEGKMLTICDATFSDKEQREAFKRIVRNELRHWFSERVQDTINISNGIWTTESSESY